MNSVSTACLTITLLLLAVLGGCHGCRYTGREVAAAVNATQGGTLDGVVVNCLSFSDASVVESGIVSWRMGSESGRYNVDCYNGILALSTSGNNYTDTVIGCTVCEDATSLQCNSGQGTWGCGLMSRGWPLWGG